MYFGSPRAFSNYGVTSSEVADAQQSARSAEQKARDLEAQVDKLTIICAAMWELLQQKTGLTEQDLVDRMTEIDLRDGTADGKITAKVHNCQKCGRPVAARHLRCLYCGEVQEVNSVFETMP